jgi:hypothetical protein
MALQCAEIRSAETMGGQGLHLMPQTLDAIYRCKNEQRCLCEMDALVEQRTKPTNDKVKGLLAGLMLFVF